MSPRGDHTLPVQPEDLPVDGTPTEMIIGDSAPPAITSSPGPRRQRPSWCLPVSLFLGAASIAIVAVVAVLLSRDDPNNSASETQVTGWIAEQGYSEVGALLDPESPQRRAALFMTQGQGIPRDVNSESGFKWMERYVLSVFFYSTNGDNWSRFLKPGFNDATKTACDWHVPVQLTSGDTIPFGASCDGNGRVDAIQIFSFYLSGTLPTELGLLTDMQFFVTPLNFIGGTIPAELGNWSKLKMFISQKNLLKGTLPNALKSLTSLEYFDCIECNLEGSIPAWINQWTSLTTLALTENKLTGSLPNSIATLTNLNDLALDDNMLTGDLAAVEDLTDLHHVYLENNGFSQVIDEGFLSKLTTLKALDISDNAFIGQVPVHLMSLESFIIMDVHGNGLQSFPDTIDKSSKVTFLAVHNNPITAATFPSTAAHLTHLRHLDITSTNFGGPMPSFLGDLNHIHYLFMADTKFNPGPIPESYQKLGKLRDLSVKSAERNGTIPTWFKDMENLLLLDLDDNSFAGPLPSALTHMPSLRYLLLNRNELTGVIPTEFHTAGNIRVLTLDHNSITGDLNPFCAIAVPTVGVTADCGGDSPQINCDCCRCCDDSSSDPCNDNDRLAQYDPDWQDGYARDGIYDYDFNKDYNFTKL